MTRGKSRSTLNSTYNKSGTYLMYGLNDKCCVGGTTGACWCCCWGGAGGWFWFWRWDFLEFHLFGLTITWRICEASNAVPGSSSTGDETWPASTHTMLGYSSSPKSGVSRALSSHGFQMTVKKMDFLDYFSLVFL